MSLALLQPLQECAPINIEEDKSHFGQVVPEGLSV